MKKIEYQAPEMEVIDMKLQGVLCVSGDGSTVDNPPSEPGTPGEY